MTKKILSLGSLLVLMCLSSFVMAQGPTIVQQSQLYTATFTATVQPTVPESSVFPVHTISVVTTGTAVGTVQMQTCTTTLTSSCSNMTGSSAVSVATCTVANPCTQTIEGVLQAFGAYTMTLSTCTSCTVSVTYQAGPYGYIQNLTDGVFWIEPNECGLALTTGAFAANPANSGGQSAPAMVRQAAGVSYMQVVTSAAASALTIDCPLMVPSRLTAGKGITVTGFNFFYGNQTSALTSITTPVVNLVTWPAPPSASPSGTVSQPAGAITLSPAAPTLTTTTAGQCNAFNATFTTPVLLNSSNTYLEATVVLNQTVAAATTYQLCGVQVLYQVDPL